MRLGEEIWQTRSTWPMSMPSSSEAVETSTFSLPSRKRSSASSRFSFERLPWCAATNSAPMRLGQLVRHALRKPPRVDHDERRAMRLDQLDEAVVDLFPHLGRHHRFERRARHFDREIDLALVAAVDDRALAFRLGADEELRDLFDRLLRRRQADALELASARVLEALERQRQMRAAARFEHGVDFVDDHDPRGLQHLARALGGEQQIQRFGRGDEDVGRLAQHSRALALRRVAAAHGRGDPHRRIAHLLRELADLAARLGEVLVDVRGQRLQRRDVDDAHLVRQLAALETFAKKLVDRRQEGGERLTRSGRRRDQRVLRRGGSPASRRAAPRSAATRCRRLPQSGQPTSAGLRGGSLEAAREFV